MDFAVLDYENALNQGTPVAEGDEELVLKYNCKSIKNKTSNNMSSVSPSFMESSSQCSSEELAAEFEKLFVKPFGDCDGDWQGDIKYENLFYFWKVVAALSNNSII